MYPRFVGSFCCVSFFFMYVRMYCLVFLLSLGLLDVDFSGESEVKAQISKQQRVVFKIEKNAKSFGFVLGIFYVCLFSFV